MTKLKRKSDVFARCPDCGEWAVDTVRIARLVGRGADRIIVEGVPTERCRSCGIHYYEPAVLRALDDIRSHPERHTHLETVRIASFERLSEAG